MSSILHDKVLVCDLITRWEQFEIPKEVEGAVDWRLTFQKSLLLPDEQTLELESATVSAMLYQQYFTQLQQGRLLPSEDDAVMLAALHLYISEGAFDAADAEELKRRVVSNIDHYVPRSLMKHLKMKSRPGRYIAKLCGLSGTIRAPVVDVATRIMTAYAALPVQKLHQTTKQWLALIKQAEFYGSSLFVVHVRHLLKFETPY